VSDSFNLSTLEVSLTFTLSGEDMNSFILDSNGFTFSAMTLSAVDREAPAIVSVDSYEVGTDSIDDLSVTTATPGTLF